MSQRYVLERTQFVPVPLERTFEFYAEPRNLARITPKWLGFRIVGFDDGETADATMRKGLRIHYRVRPLGFPQRWTSEITEWNPPAGFVDEQRSGPYRSWHHEHSFRAVDGGTEIGDRVEYELPFGPLGRIGHALFVRRQLEAIFDHREEVVGELLE